MPNDSIFCADFEQKEYRNHASHLLFGKIVDETFEFPIFVTTPTAKHIPEEIIIWALTESQLDKKKKKTVVRVIRLLNQKKLDADSLVFNLVTRYGGRHAIHFWNANEDVVLNIKFEESPRALELLSKRDLTIKTLLRISNETWQQVKIEEQCPHPPFELAEFPSTAMHRLNSPSVPIGVRYLAAIWTGDAMLKEALWMENRDLGRQDLETFKDHYGHSIYDHQTYHYNAVPSGMLLRAFEGQVLAMMASYACNLR